MTKTTIKEAVATETADTEAIHWRDAMISGIRGIHLKSLTPKMLDEEGEILEVGKGEDTTKVLFDIDFVKQVILDRILQPLALVSPQGKVKATYLTQTLVPEIISYAESATAREMEQRLRETAALMSQLNGLSIEENIARINNS